MTNKKELRFLLATLRLHQMNLIHMALFNVEVRDVRDSDNAPVILERFTSVNLNPNHPKYIARVIGDQFIVWDDTERRYRTYGNYKNNSSIIRVEMNEDVEAGATDARFLAIRFFWTSSILKELG